MNATGQFGDDDLALYAMQLLAETEATAVARQIADNPELRERFALICAELGLFAEASVDLQPAPEASLARLMSRIAQDKKVVPIAGPSPSASEATLTTAVKSKHQMTTAAAWIGWAVAACLVAVVGRLYQTDVTLHRSVGAAQAQAAQSSGEVSNARQERDALKAQVASEANRVQQLSGETQIAQQNNQTLRSKVESRTGELAEQARLAAQAQRDRDQMQQTAAAEANQLAQLATDAARAREIVAALTDKTALQVSLTRPKSRPAPSGHATYVASRGTLVFLASNLASLKPNKVYQLWLLPANGANPVPAGTFTPDARGNASFINEHFPQTVGAAGFAVTMENVGGAQTPTLPILLAGKAT